MLWMWLVGLIVQGLIFGFAAQHIAESKGYQTGFAWGFWLSWIGLLVVVARPNMVVPVQTENGARLIHLAENMPDTRTKTASEHQWQCICGTKNPSGATVCQSCRQPRNAMERNYEKVRCPHCGAMTRKENRLCFACSQPWAEPERTSIPPVSEVVPPRVDNPTNRLFKACYQDTLSDVIARAKDQCYRYNQLHPNDREGQARLLKSLLGSMGENVMICQPFWCDYGYHLSVGSNFYANHNLVVTDGACVTFGDDVFVGPNCCFTTAEHAIDPGQRRVGMEIAKPITVGSNVWFGAGVTVLAGVTIGDNTVVGAGSVVTRDLPANVVAVGVPCRVLRPITAEDRTRYPMD